MPESFLHMEIELNLLTMCIQCGIIEIESGKFFLYSMCLFSERWNMYVHNRGN